MDNNPQLSKEKKRGHGRSLYCELHWIKMYRNTSETCGTGGGGVISTNIVRCIGRVLSYVKKKSTGEIWGGGGLYP